MNVFKKGVSKLKDIKTFWNEPKKGNYMPYKEIFAYSVGGFGAYSIFMVAQTLLLSTTNVIIGNTIGIQPMHIYVMYLLSVVLNIPLTMLRANMVDNVRYRGGKYRPYLLRMGVPTVLISVLFVFTPYGSVAYIWRCILIFIYNFGLQFFYNFFYDAYENLIYVLSPNSQERTNVTAIKSIIYSFSPTVINFVIPLVAGKVAGGNIYDLTVYRCLFPIISVFGVALIILVYAKTQEKIIVAKSQPMKVKFMDALREVAKNKYFWIISLAGWLGFLETCTFIVLQWLYNYAHLCTPEQYSLITVFKGTAYFFGMVIAPFAIKKWGKKKVLIATNIFNVLFLALVYPLMHSIWTVLMCMYFNSIADSFIIILTPAIQADIRDYQQYKSGERIDGMFGAVALIGSFVTMATSSVLPAVYEKYGIYQGNGYENMYDVLYDLPTLYRLVGVLVILSAVGAALNAIPYFFYDLTETKQKAIVKILKIRAMFEDYGNGVLKDEDMKGTMLLIKEAKESIAGGKEDIKALKAQKADKKTIKAAELKNEEYEESLMVMEEMERFTREDSIARLEWAKRIVANGLQGIPYIDESEVERAKAMPKDTAMEKAKRKASIEDAKLGVRSKLAANKYYPDGKIEFDKKAYDDLYDEYNLVMEEKAKLLKEKGSKEDIEWIKIKQKEITVIMKKANEERERYLQATAVFAAAEKYVRWAENYARFGEIREKYSALSVDAS
ncbi:MAG: MFS transporter [Clostridia bacterium]|nr:MFS transporter [Clostridia bacterium]